MNLLIFFMTSATWIMSGDALGCFGLRQDQTSSGRVNYIGVGDVPPGYRHIAHPHWVKDPSGGYGRKLYVKTFFYSSTGSEVATYPAGKEAFSFSTKQKTGMFINPEPFNPNKSHTTGRVNLDVSSGHKQIKLTLIAGERENTYLSCSDKTTFDFNFSNEQTTKYFCNTYISQSATSKSVKIIDDLIDISLDDSPKTKGPNIVYSLKRKEKYSVELLWNKDLIQETTHITPQANSSISELPTLTDTSTLTDHANAQILIKNNKGDVITTFNIHLFAPNQLTLLNGNEKLLTYRLHDNKATRLNKIYSTYKSDWKSGAEQTYPIISLILTAIGASYWSQSY